jgi:hypothetical protein
MTSLPYSRLVTSECTCRGWPSASSRGRGTFSSGTSFSLIEMTSLPHSRLGILKHLKRLGISKQQRERSLLKWNLIIADRDDIIASLKVSHLKEYLKRLAISKHKWEMTSSPHSRLGILRNIWRGWPSAYSRKRRVF